MSTQSLARVLPATDGAPRVGQPVRVSRFQAAGVAAARGIWDFLKNVGEFRARKEMRLLADSVALTRPELAARLHAAARQSWM